MGQWTIKALRKIDTERRLHVAAYIFWASIALGVFCTLFVAKDPFEKVLMAISWGAITISALDVILTADVRDNEE